MQHKGTGFNTKYAVGQTEAEFIAEHKDGQFLELPEAERIKELKAAYAKCHQIEGTKPAKAKS